MSGASEECRQPSGGVSCDWTASLVILKIQMSVEY